MTSEKVSSKHRSSSSKRRESSAAATQQQAEEGADNGQETIPQEVVDVPVSQPRQMAVGRSMELAAPVEIVMDALVDKLKLLDYERDFCKKKKPYRKPISRLFFALPDPSVNQSQQYFYFSSLAAWLLGLAGVDVPSPKEFDDPNATCSTLLGGCKKLGFASPSYHASKLTTGYGKEVVGVLDGLTDYVLERRNFTYRKPLYLPDQYNDEAEVEDDGALDADQATEFARPRYLDEEEEEAFMQADPAELVGLGPGSAAAAAKPPGSAPTPHSSVPEEKQILQCKVDPTAWRLEVERVTPKLRILLNADAKDWRSHLEEVGQHTKSISAVWPDSKLVLDKLRGELDAALDKLSTRERFLNDHFESLMRHYRTARAQLTNVQSTYNAHTEAISTRNSELHRITEQLAEMKTVMDEHSTNISDATPVVRIKNAIKKLSEELHETEVRIGVVSHTLLQLSLKNKRALQAAAAAAVSDDEDDL